MLGEVLLMVSAGFLTGIISVVTTNVDRIRSVFLLSLLFILLASVFSVCGITIPYIVSIILSSFAGIYLFFDFI